MLTIKECYSLLAKADLIYNEAYCEAKLQELAFKINTSLQDKFPLVLSIMGGAVVFAGKLLPLLTFPLEFDYIHVSRYRQKLKGSDFQWHKMPQRSQVEGREILLLDDILDEGHTLLAVREKVLALGAVGCYCAVFADKTLNIEKPIQADFVALHTPNRYVFGYGMDIKGYWRNLPAIYAL